MASKYVGDGPKNIRAMFCAAQRDDAVLFVDEAESLLSRRSTELSQASEHSLNAMRSQLIVELGRFEGLAVFATNLVQTYDKAFETRLRTIKFSLPDLEMRKKIWMWHLPSSLPGSEDIAIDEIAEIDNICGRDIRNAVVGCALRVARTGETRVTQAGLHSALNLIIRSRIEEEEGKGEIASLIKEKLASKKTKRAEEEEEEEEEADSLG